jgi:small-conductance mechanosensitive channel
VINWTFADRRPRATLQLGVAYGTDPERVIALLEGVANAHPFALDDPPPQAVFAGFGESALEFELAWHLAPDAPPSARSEVAIAVNRVLSEAGIEIPPPQRELRVRPTDAKSPPPARGEPE